jgi:hypothetical protein
MGRCQAGVVRPLALDPLRSNQVKPRFKDAALVTQQREQSNKSGNAAISLLNGEPQAIFLCWASGDDPELVNHLRYKAKLVPLTRQSSQRVMGNSMQRVLWL